MGIEEKPTSKPQGICRTVADGKVFQYDKPILPKIAANILSRELTAVFQPNQGLYIVQTK